MDLRLAEIGAAPPPRAEGVCLGGWATSGPVRYWPRFPASSAAPSGVAYAKIGGGRNVSMVGAYSVRCGIRSLRGLFIG